MNIILRELILLDFTDEIAAVYGENRACGFPRRKIVDRMSAATALMHDLALVTFNERNFRDAPRLRLLGREHA